MTFNKAAFLRLAKSSEFKKLCKSFHEAKELSDKETSRIEKIGNSILAEMDLRDAHTGERILNHNLAWTATEADAQVYIDALHEANTADGYKLENGYCPALMAQHAVRKLEWALIGMWVDCGQPAPTLTEDRRAVIDGLLKAGEALFAKLD